mgnify:CR=1 FL=1
MPPKLGLRPLTTDVLALAVEAEKRSGSPGLFVFQVWSEHYGHKGQPLPEEGDERGK